jgi:hypothetical protein
MTYVNYFIGGRDVLYSAFTYGDMDSDCSGIQLLPN